MAEKVPMTKQGYQALKEKLKRMKTGERRAIVEEIERARGYGDLSENAEYHAAKEKQGILEAQIREIEDKLARAEVIDISTLSGDRVVFGATVTLYDVDNGEETTYQIVGDDEANYELKKISLNSPIAKAVLGKYLDDEVEVKTPGGVRRFEVVDVKYLP
ncbi:MAG: transcription elongation factor GreA [Myxococcota bacterium]